MDIYMDQVKRAFCDGKVAVYLRTAQQNQKDGTGLIDQFEKISRCFPDVNWSRVPIYKDSGVGGFVEIRPGLNRLFQSVKAKKYKIVLATDPARFSRNITQLLRLKVFAIKNECEFLSLPEILKEVRS